MDDQTNNQGDGAQATAGPELGECIQRKRKKRWTTYGNAPDEVREAVARGGHENVTDDAVVIVYPNGDATPITREQFDASWEPI